MRNLRFAALGIALACVTAAHAQNDASGKTGEPLRPSHPVRLEITSPAEGEVVRSANGEVSFSFRLWNYNLATGGNHLHLIVDGKPYVPVYDVSKPFVYPEKLSDGVHTAVTFPSRPWHEAWKDPQGVSVITFYVNKRTGARPIDDSKPLLLFSRPKGTQEGADLNSPTNAARILFDFFLWNADLRPDGYRVELGINGRTWYTTEWRPYWITGLKDGTHIFTLRLVDARGNTVKTPYAPYRREIVVKGAPADGPADITFTPIVPGPGGNAFDEPGGHMMH